MLQDNLRNTKW